MPKVCFKLYKIDSSENTYLSIKFNDYSKISEAVYKNYFRLKVYFLECNRLNRDVYSLVFQKHLSREVLSLGDDLILNFDSKNTLGKYLIEV